MYFLVMIIGARLGVGIEVIETRDYKVVGLNERTGGTDAAPMLYSQQEGNVGFVILAYGTDREALEARAHELSQQDG